MDPRLIASGLVAVFVASLLVGLAPAQAQSPPGPGSTSGTAGNLGSLALDSEVRLFGEILADTRENNWWKFNVPSVTGTPGRPIIEVTLSSDWGNAYELHLYQGSPSDPIAVGQGPAGAKYIRYIASVAGEWYIRVLGETSGRHQVTVSLLREDDNHEARNTPDSATTGIHLGTIPLNGGRVVHGGITPGDTGDRYRFTVGSSGSSVLVTLHHPPTTALDLGLGVTTGPLEQEPTERTGDGFASIHATGVTAGTHTVRVAPVEAGIGGPYVLGIVFGPSESGDLGTGDDAPNDFNSAMPLPQGLNVGTIDSTADQVDVYKLENVEAGDTLRFGASSYQSGTFSQPRLLLTLFNPDRAVVSAIGEIAVCGEAGGAAWTAPAGGTWYLRIREHAAANNACGGIQTPTRSGNYALFYLRTAQDDAGTGGDAPAATSNAPVLPDDQMKTGWLDRSDRIDAYRLGSLSTGDVVRVHAASTVPGMHLKLTLFSPTGSQTVTSQTGVVRIHTSVTGPGTHSIQVEQPTTSHTEGPYRFYARVTGDEPPPPVTLEAIRMSDRTRTTVDLRWSQVPDPDFARYEVHRSTVSGFTPSSGTLAATITNRATTAHTVTGLAAGTTYHFLIRTVDPAGQSADSNRRTTTTEDIDLTNNPPQLSGGKVDPTAGNPSTLFTYSVQYRDADNDAPTIQRVYINGTPHTMQAQGSNWAGGVTFTFQTTMPAGNHNFYFEFSDGTATRRDPSGVLQSAYEGPSVAAQGNRPPTVSADADPREGEAPLEVQFTATASDPDGDPLTYSWDFDNSDGIQQDSTERDPFHTYEEAGTYTATVRVTDPHGASATSSVTVFVQAPSNLPPTVSPTATPASGQAPLTIQFQANAQDEDGEVVAYAWDFDNSDGIQVESTEENPTHTYTSGGSFTATVTVTDDGGAKATGSVTVTVSTPDNHPPGITIEANPAQGRAPLTVDFTATVVDPDGDPVTVQWDFDRSDGIQTDGTGLQASHTYQEPGTYIATAIARDDKGASATATIEIRVRPPLGADPNGQVFIEADPRSGRAPLEVEFFADTQGMTTAPVAYLWDFGDGNTTDEGPSTFYVFDAPGLYRVVLSVTDNTGNVHDSTIDIQVRAGGTPSVGHLLVLAILGLAGLLVGSRRSGPGEGR